MPCVDPQKFRRNCVHVNTFFAFENYCRRDDYSLVRTIFIDEDVTRLQLRVWFGRFLHFFRSSAKTVRKNKRQQTNSQFDGSIELMYFSPKATQSVPFGIPSMGLVATLWRFYRSMHLYIYPHIELLCFVTPVQVYRDRSEIDDGECKFE